MRTIATLVGLALTFAASSASAASFSCSASFTTSCPGLNTPYCARLQGSSTQLPPLNTSRVRVSGVNSNRTVVAGEEPISAVVSIVTSLLGLLTKTANVDIKVPLPAAIWNDSSNPDYAISSCNLLWVE